MKILFKPLEPTTECLTAEPYRQPAHAEIGQTTHSMLRLGNYLFYLDVKESQPLKHCVLNQSCVVDRIQITNSGSGPVYVWNGDDPAALTPDNCSAILNCFESLVIPRPTGSLYLLTKGDSRLSIAYQGISSPFQPYRV